MVLRGSCVLQQITGCSTVDDVELRSGLVQVRVRPSALAALDKAVGDEGRSVWLRALISWALESGWRPGQDWKRDFGLQYTPADGPQVVYDGPLSRMEVARAALASAEFRSEPVEEGA